MKRWLLLAVFLCVGLAVGFIVGARWASSTAGVTLTISNSTSRPISTVRITHEGGVQLVEDIPPSASRTTTFLAHGETSYSLSVSFADGSTIKSESRYAESGYHITERVADHTIEPEFHSLY